MSLLAVPLSIALTILCWGAYGVLLHKGALQMDESRLRPFICLGLAYFVIAVLVPAIWLRLYGEKGKWTATGTLWSFIAGAAGALGALGIILALTFGGNPIYVMPLVFGGAPVVNTFTTMYMGRSFKNISPVFLAGLILVIAGAVMVLVFKPGAGVGSEGVFGGLTAKDLALILGSVLLTVITWGAYGPMLHRGQMAMQGSRLRPLLCVGLAYFVIAVALPFALMPFLNDPGDWTVRGTLWSLAGGAVGALGAIGIILAFNYGGKPIYVMPLVFGGAPLINTFASMAAAPPSESIGPVFIAGLIIVVIGAVTVLVFAPKTPPHAHMPAAAAPSPTAPKHEPAKT
jgi:hypothetical protein